MSKTTTTIMSGSLQSLEDSIADESLPPLLKVALPFSHRINCFIRLWLFKFMVTIVFSIHRIFYPTSPTRQPTLLKNYPCRPFLQNRVFLPPNYQAGDVLPLYLDIHGGGFALCDPQFDDKFCVSWAKRTGMLVVSLDYRKAPLHPFPTPVFDIGAVARAVIDDSTLPIDKTKIVIGGFSAGGNLALGASQLPELKGLIKAAVTFYPIVDFGHPPEHKLSMRPYKNGPKDNLETSSPWFDWGYVPVGQNRRDPLLSPCYARRTDLPKWIYIAAAQYDMLRLEAQDMMHHISDQQQREDQEAPFEKGTYKWTLVMGAKHGFTHHFGGNKAKREERERKCQELYAEADAWLKNGPLA
ncbi:MAG: hypothetical protein M1827_005674 [Pycnora praestabilis]|nr:MAG: hypothetical protein M1827_005674 [Pycnora praestabilis]